jgi:hypothetical protein
MRRIREDRRREWRRQLFAALIVGVIAIPACDVPHPVAPTPSQPTRQPPAFHYRDIPQSEIDARIGTLTTLREGMRKFPTLAPSSESGVEFSTIVDTLYGALITQISETQAQANGYSLATTYGGPVVNTWMNADLETSTGFQIPQTMSLSCSGNAQGHPTWCGDADMNAVNCDDPDGARIEGWSLHTVLYLDGREREGDVDGEKTCGTSNNGGGGQNPGPQNCSTWYIEGSDDGGATWYLIAIIEICNN